MTSILILTNKISGIYSFRRELILELLEKGNKIIISAPKDDRLEYFLDIGCEWIETPISRHGKNPLTDFRLFLKYEKVLKDTKPDVVLTYTVKPNAYGGLACRLLGIKHIANITGLGTAVENKGILQKIILFLYKFSLNKAICVFFQNEESRVFLNQKNIALNNNRLVPGSGVNLEHFYFMEYPSSEKLIFLYIGRIMKAKGINQYLEAAEYIKEKYANTEFHILGTFEEDYEKKIMSLQERGIIKFHGRQKDVRDYHKISHCTIHPSYYPEGMSNVLLESAACGRPVITTNRSGCKEIVNDKISGFLVKEKNSEDLIDKIESFIALTHEEREKMGLEGRKKVAREFNREIVIKAYIEELKKIQEQKLNQ